VTMIRWAKGGTASFIAAQGENVTLRSSSPSPPGSRLEATFEAEPQSVVRVKVHGSKKEEDGSFTIKGRLVDATREIRERVHALVGTAQSG
jgi:hypothetical protein